MVVVLKTRSQSDEEGFEAELRAGILIWAGKLTKTCVQSLEKMSFMLAPEVDFKLDIIINIL